MPLQNSVNMWERAYLEFETPEEEVKKFRNRLFKLGALHWPKDAAIVELFCGRGSGLRALEEMGFFNLEGVDLSGALLSQYKGRARCLVSDCRHLELSSFSKDIVIVQGGLHHLANLAEDLEQTLSEARRILKDKGILVVVEPWKTPFLDFVHAVTRIKLARLLSKKIDAFATMVEHERDTYEAWLNAPEAVLSAFNKFFVKKNLRIWMGKIFFLGEIKGVVN